MVTAGGPHYGPLLEMNSDQVHHALGSHVVMALEVGNAAVKMRPGVVPRGQGGEVDGALSVAGSYTAESWSALVKTPHDRLEAVRPVVERLGGRLDNAWLAFGDYDVVALFEAPDNVTAAAFSMALSAAGGVKAVKTTPLMTFEDGMAAMRKVAHARYQPPTDWGMSYG